MKGKILLTEMMKYYGLKEVDGPSNNKELIELIRTVISWATDDSKIAWCAIMVTFLFDKLGWRSMVPDKPAGARSWMNIKGDHKVIWKEGDDIKLISKLAEPGDIVIFYRGAKDGWQGHIALYINEFHNDRSKIRVLGGNQDNAVTIRAYEKSKVLKIIRI